MKILKLIELIFLFLIIIAPTRIRADNEMEESSDQQPDAEISTFQEQIPVLTRKPENQVLLIKLQVDSPSKFTVEKIKINLQGTTDIKDIASVKIAYLGNDAGSPAKRQFGETGGGAQSIVFTDQLEVTDQNTYFSVLIQLKDTIDLTHKVNVACEFIKTDAGRIDNQEKPKRAGLRVGVALRQHGDDNVHTYRIPGLTTTADGVLLAIYDVRHDRNRDLQGNIDIGLSRSTNGGKTWEPMRIVLDRGAWGGLPEKFNGIADANILVDENTHTIFVAGLWMHGVINSNGQWIEDLSESSTAWNHQWRNKGSQPGFGVKETSQFLITKSTDHGKTWSEPVNLTRKLKKKDWWLLAPAPGHGITLDNGILVMPVQGRDKTGLPFSSIIWSKNHGKSWHMGNPAYHNTTESMAVQLSDGSIMLNMRHNDNKNNTSDSNGRAIAVTHDLGKTWTEHPTSRHALIEPRCMASLHKHEYTENGQRKSILLFSNPNSKTSRDHITIKVSFDNGATWPEEYWMLLDENKGRGYSCLTSIDEQTIGILYEGSQADMTFQKIPLSELIGK